MPLRHFNRTKSSRNGIYVTRGLRQTGSRTARTRTCQTARGARGIAEARDKGDLSENFEYHAAKREQGRLLSRIRFKRRVLENARVIDRSAIRHTGIGLLSVVTLTNVANGAHMTYTIVSPHEANMSEGKISLKSPIAQALLNHQSGDTVEVSVPAGKITLRIDEVTL